MICLERESGSAQEPYELHAVSNDRRTPRQMYIPFSSPRLANAVTRLVQALGCPPTIIYGAGLWGHPAVRARDNLSRRSIQCAALVGSYTTYLDESLSNWRGLVRSGTLATKIKYAAEQGWIRAVLARYERHTYRSADRLLINYRSVEGLIRSRVGNDVRCEMVPYTIPSEFEPNLRTPVPRVAADGARSRPIIVSISRHQPRKGVDVLLRSLSHIRAQGYCFQANLIGVGELLEENRRLANELGLSDCVAILGRVRSVQDYLREADIFVLPSREEQSGSMALLEAMQAGIACVASACDGIPEDVVHLSDAWLATPGEHVSLGEGIAALIRDSSLRERLGRGGQNTFAARFSRERFCTALAGIYSDALAHGRTARE
jgi:glycosyltransferase involved in cell wall biosynthesis